MPGARRSAVDCPLGGRGDVNLMATLLYSHPACREHLPGRQHPERPERLDAVLERLSTPGYAPLLQRRPTPADIETLSRVHRAGYVDATLDAVPETGRAFLDPDTAVSAGSHEAALLAAGACVAAVDAVLAGEADNAFCAVRPPGHHAEADRAMGFCLFNNIAVAALHARAAHGLRRLAVVDFDVHHGNGTQAMFYADPDLFYGSTHQYPYYPGTGARAERGVAGNIVNEPLAAGSGSAEFRAAMRDSMLPALDAFKPELLLVSAGFDAHAADPLADIRLTEVDFEWVTRELMAVADRHCGRRLVSTLEGGYHLGALADSVGAHVATLMTP